MKRIILTALIGVGSIMFGMAQGEPAPSKELDSTLRSPYIAQLTEQLVLSSEQATAIAEIYNRYALHIEMMGSQEMEDSMVDSKALIAQKNIEIYAVLDEQQRKHFREMTDGTRKRNKMKGSAKVVDNPSESE